MTKKITRHNNVRKLALVGAASFIIISTSAFAQARNYDIAPGSLSYALRQFGQKSGKQIIFTEDLVRGKRSPQLKGSFTSEQALQLVLSQSGLRADTTASGAIMVMRSQNTQVVSTDNASSVDALAGLEGTDIVVTAQKRTESIQHVPISIQALSPATLERHQVKNFDDYAKLLPSVSYQSFGPGQSQIFFRGISSGSDGLPGGTLPTSGVYLDEIPVTTIGALLDVHAYDIARIEALSGPQGTLYGASSLSGTLRIITNKPDPSKFSAGYDLQGNKFGKGDVGGVAEGFVNLPLNDRMALRLVGFYQHDGGYIDNKPGSRTYTLGDANPANDITINNNGFVKKDFNDNETYGGRLALGIELDDNWTITPTIVAQHQKAHGAFLYDPRAGDLAVHDFTPEHALDKWYQAALTIEGKLADWDVTYAGGYLQRTLDTQADYSYYTVAYDNVPGITNFPIPGGGFLDPTQNYETHQALTKQTHELRVASPTDRPFHLTAGMFMQRQANKNLQEFIIPGLSTIGNQAIRGDDIYIADTHYVTKDYAAFGEATYNLTSQLTVTAGIRGFFYKNTRTGFSGYARNARAMGCTVPVLDASDCPNPPKKATDAGETHKLNVTWQVDPDRMVYATYSTGFRPGGTNRRIGVNPYDPDTVDNFELGWKTSWLDRKLRLNGAIYYEEWNKLQYALSPVGSTGVRNGYNAGDARIYGIEADFQLLIGALTLSGAGSYNDAKLTTNFCQINPAGNSDCSSGIFEAPKGTRLPIQPKFKGNATARYEFNLGSIASFVQGSMLYKGSTRSYLGVLEGDLLGDTPAFTTFDFSAGGKINDWSIEFFIQNAFDKRGELSRNTICAPNICGQYYRVYPIKPQFFGIKVAQRF